MQVLHLPRIAAPKPFWQVLKFLEHFRFNTIFGVRCPAELSIQRCDSAKIKPRGSRTIIDPMCPLGWRHIAIMHQASVAEKSGFVHLRAKPLTRPFAAVFVFPDCR
jgi:hypothetical protein